MSPATIRSETPRTTHESGGVPPGYRRTDIGIIPIDWDTRSLGEIGQCLIGLTYDPSNVGSDGLLVLRASNIGDGGLQFGADVFVDMEVPERIIVRDGDLLICVRNGSRLLIGKCALIDDRAKGMTFGAFMSVLRSPHNRFVAYCFQSDLVKRQIHEHLGATINQITNRSLNSFRIPFPPPGERRAIAEALSDMDGLLEALESVIAKKRAIKQGAMQQLLTGKTRLPGFTGAWETRRLGDIASVRNQKVLPAQVDPDTPCVELEHIGQGDGRLLASSTARYSTSAKYRFVAGDVLFGRLRSYLRKFWHADRDGICTTEVWPLMVEAKQVASAFLHAIVQSDRFIEAASISYGTHMPRADWGVMRNLEVRLPHIDEQQGIATVLSDMDAEIAALERRRDKTRSIKQGMMQQLLTGRVRLIKPSHEEAGA
jgi:type I restriction enzyme S subunit